jgi:hypothetical protein
MSKEREDNIQYLLDQVARLTAENAMLKEKWSTPKPESEQQPEAWIIVNKETGFRTQVASIAPFMYEKDMFEVIPLYTHPKPEPLSEDKLDVLAEANMTKFYNAEEWMQELTNLWREAHDTKETKPPKPEQESVAWMVETHFNNEPIKEFHTVKPMERVYKYCKVTELFATPQKREPLSLEELCKLYGDNVVEDIFAFARAIEKAHGIGGGE